MANAKSSCFAVVIATTDSIKPANAIKITGVMLFFLGSVVICLVAFLGEELRGGTGRGC
jgi:hypothetical protein